MSLQSDEKNIDEMIDKFIDTMKSKRGRFSHYQENEMIHNVHVLSQSVHNFFFNKSEVIKMNCYPYLRLISKEHNFHYHVLIYRPDYFSVS